MTNDPHEAQRQRSGEPPSATRCGARRWPGCPRAAKRSGTWRAPGPVTAVIGQCCFDRPRKRRWGPPAPSA